MLISITSACFRSTICYTYSWLMKKKWKNNKLMEQTVFNKRSMSHWRISLHVSYMSCKGTLDSLLTGEKQRNIFAGFSKLGFNWYSPRSSSLVFTRWKPVYSVTENWESRITNKLKLKNHVSRENNQWIAPITTHANKRLWVFAQDNNVKSKLSSERILDV